MAANTTEAPFWIPDLTAAEAASSAKCMERRELFTYVLCSLATWAAALVLTLIPRLLIAPCRDAIQQTAQGGCKRAKKGIPRWLTIKKFFS